MRRVVEMRVLSWEIRFVLRFWALCVLLSVWVSEFCAVCDADVDCDDDSEMVTDALNLSR